MQALAAQQKTSLFDILRYAKEDIAAVAAPLGIDAISLIAQLSSQNAVLKGNAVPVLQKRYQGCCSVTYFVNTTPNGQVWPFIRFHTFKDGGATADFNGLRWLKRHPLLLANPSLSTIVPTAMVSNTRALSPSELRYENQRKQYFTYLSKAFNAASRVEASHAYLNKRLMGLANSNLLSRINLREHSGKFWVPIERIGSCIVGFQAINPEVETDNKRNHVAFAGAMKSSFVKIAPVQGLKYYPILFCEGVITALTLALVWPGEIRAVLSCTNYVQCRASLNEHVYFAPDMDIYKPALGNVGLQHALAVSKPGDYFITPQFLQADRVGKPTDFNDVLRLYGIKTLQRLIEQVRQRPIDC